MSYDQANSESLASTRAAASEAVLTEAIRQVDIVHTSLAGMLAIVVMLLVAIALPSFGMPPVRHVGALIIMAFTAFVGIGGLYVLNYRVHKHVANQARLTEVLVNSLGQGFLTFDQAGLCGRVYSQACLDLLETVPAGKNIQEVLRIPPEQKVDFQDWLNILFQPDHALGFSDVVQFLPPFFPHSYQRRVSLVYRPIYGRDEHLMSVVVIATDQTDEYAAQQNAKQQQAFAEMICRIFRGRNQFHSTLAHVRVFLDAAGAAKVGLKDADTLLRQLHTLKAAVKQFNLLELGETIHHLENDLRSPLIVDDEAFRAHLTVGRQRVADGLLRVMDEVKDLLGSEYEWRGNVREIEEVDLYEFARAMKAHNADPELIRHYLSTIAAVPVRDCFHSFARELQELAVVMDKQVKPIRYTGSNPRVLTQTIHDFLFALTHICRNIIDHGIEPPVTRMARGKDPAGQVTVMTEVLKEDGEEWLHFVIHDDGNGIDPSRIRAKLATVDPDGSWRDEDDQTVIQRIFSWGFSTSENVTSFSGRGVGMEAVEREVKMLGGTIRVQSELYKGASFDIRIPYCLDIEQISNLPSDKIPASA